MRHVFMVADIINKAGLTDKVELFISGAFASEGTPEEIERKQIESSSELLKLVMKGLPLVYKEVAELLADTQGITVDEASDLSITDTLGLFMAIVKNDEVLAFFTPAA